MCALVSILCLVFFVQQSMSATLIFNIEKKSEYALLVYFCLTLWSFVAYTVKHHSEKQIF